jgi:hypothetical protein
MTAPPTRCQTTEVRKRSLLDSRTTSWCNSFLICSGGFRCASTTVYYLPALQADAQNTLLDTPRGAQ